MKKIVIIGGGFTGTLTAINLLRLSSLPLHITIIDKSRSPGRGIAYGTRNSSHLLNVLARNMSALADRPDHFVEWLGTRSEYLDLPVAALKEKFIPRRIYGDYLQSLFLWYSQTVAGENGSKLETISNEATSIVTENQRATVTLAGGETIVADKVVLAVGNQAPAHLRLPGLNVANPRYIANPWIGWEEKLPDPKEDLLLIGTGLTMVDVFLTLKDIGWQGKIYAVSRHGLLPLSHFKGPEYPDLLNDEMTRITLRKMFSIFKHHYRETKARGINPAILVDKLRPFTQRIWQNFSPTEKLRFDRHFRTYWNVTRHRIAPEIHAQLSEALATKRLEVIKGRLFECQESPGSIKVWVESHRVKRLFEAGALINCTGPRDGYIPPQSPLLKHLFANGMIQPDEVNMGIKVGADYSVLDDASNPSSVLFALGALLKGTLWETTAVPELRSQCFRLATTIVGQLKAQKSETTSISETVEDVIEYSI